MGTVVDIAPLAEIALPAKCLHIHSHPVSGLKPSYRLPGLLHYAHKLVSQYGSRHSPWDSAVFNMDIAGTDGGKGHLYNGILRIFQPGDRPVFQGYDTIFLIDGGFHCLGLRSPGLGSRGLRNRGLGRLRLGRLGLGHLSLHIALHLYYTSDLLLFSPISSYHIYINIRIL